MRRELQVPVSVGTVVRMRPTQREEVFRPSPAGDVPSGTGEGVAPLPLGPVPTRVAAALIRAPLWKSTVFDPRDDGLRNRMPPSGLRLIRAKVDFVRGRKLLQFTPPFPPSAWTMSRQVARTIRPRIRPGQADALRCLLTSMADPADCQALPFERLATTHLARRFPARIRGLRFLAGLPGPPDQNQSRRTP